MAEHDERGPVIAAFLANLGVAAAKMVGFLVTGAASMLAEAIHSVADTANQGLLLLGQRRGARAPTPEHPFGFGRERYFWSFVVALVLFTGGGLFALFEAEEKLRRPHELGSHGWAIGILVAAVVMEAFSLRTAVRSGRKAKGRGSWWRFIRSTKSAELPVVLLEDTGALLGLAFAVAGVGLAAITGNPRFDALGSLAIGLLLVVIAITLAAEMKSLLIGESIGGEQMAAICRVMEADGGVDRVIDLRTVQMSPDRAFVAARVAIRGGGSMVFDALDRLQEGIEEVVPNATVYLQPEPPGSAARRPAEGGAQL